jgi:hypothetical protein
MATVVPGNDDGESIDHMQDAPDPVCGALDQGENAREIYTTTQSNPTTLIHRRTSRRRHALRGHIKTGAGCKKKPAPTSVGADAFSYFRQPRTQDLIAHLSLSEASADEANNQAP